MDGSIPTIQQISRRYILGKVSIIKLKRNIPLHPNISISHLSSFNETSPKLKALFFETQNLKNGMFNFYDVGYYSRNYEIICITNESFGMTSSEILGGVLYESNIVIGLMIEGEEFSNNDNICFIDMKYYSESILEKINNHEI